MQKVSLLCVGKIKSNWIADGCEDYIERLKRVVGLDIVELPASKERSSEKQIIDESERLQDALKKKKGTVWLLDERGERMTSHEFADVLGHAHDSGEALTFVLGGAYGLSSEIKKQGRLRLSDMTLPHELCRVLFLEQLYRGFEIRKGSGYQH